MPEAKIGCRVCGHDHVREGKRTCNAHSRRAAPLRPCRLFPPEGLSVCRFHGGMAPQVVRAGGRRYIKEIIEGVASEYFATHPYSPPLLPEPLPDPPPPQQPGKRPKKGGHKNPNSWSATRPRFRREPFPGDERAERAESERNEQGE